MTRYLLTFRGVPKGALGSIWATQHVVREVAADTIEAARLSAYDTHEHIAPPHGGFVACAALPVDAKPVTESRHWVRS